MHPLKPGTHAPSDLRSFLRRHEPASGPSRDVPPVGVISNRSSRRRSLAGGGDVSGRPAEPQLPDIARSRLVRIVWVDRPWRSRTQPRWLTTPPARDRRDDFPRGSSRTSQERSALRPAAGAGCSTDNTHHVCQTDSDPDDTTNEWPKASLGPSPTLFRVRRVRRVPNPLRS